MRTRRQYEADRNNRWKSNQANSNPFKRQQTESKSGTKATGGGASIVALGVALLILSNASAPHGHPKPAATVTVQSPAPTATVTVITPAPEPTITVVASSGGSGVLPALGQVGGFLVGVGTMLVGVTAVVKRRGKTKGKAKPESSQASAD